VSLEVFGGYARLTSRRVRGTPGNRSRCHSDTGGEDSGIADKSIGVDDQLSCVLQKFARDVKDGCKIVVNCSGRGDKDVNTAARYLKEMQDPAKGDKM
jgi:hypothetical protein